MPRKPLFPFKQAVDVDCLLFLLGSAYLSLQLSKNLPPILNTYTLAVGFIAIASILGSDKQ